MAPVEPPPTRWGLPPPSEADEHGVAGVGADLEPGTLLAAYRSGLFPMGLGGNGRDPLGWWSPDPRGVVPLDGLHRSRSLRKACRRYEVRVDTVFAEVVAGCADPTREGAWITPAIADAYTRLHELGWAHSIEVWDEEGLAGGLYGVAIGGLFAGESMFHRRTDASKVALVALVDLCATTAMPVACSTCSGPPTTSAPWGRSRSLEREYLERLAAALEAPLPARWV